MFFNYIKSAFIRKNIGLYVFSFALLSGQNNPNYSLNFDGVDDYVALPDLPSNLNSFSYMGWFKKGDANDIGQPIINTPNGKLIFSSSGQSLYAAAYQNRNGAGPSYDLGTNNFGGVDTWNHFAFTVDGQSSFLYVNGQLVDDESDFYDFQNVYTNSQIGSEGKSNSANDSYFSGNLDDISIWGTPLTINEVQNYMSTQLYGEEPGLLGYWNFNEGEGTTLTDLSGNGNHGTINGATWSTDVPILDQQNELNGFTYGGDFEGSAYYVSETQMLWQDANVAAENAGGHLVVISSEEENIFVSNLYNTGDFTEGGETTSRLWLGLVYDNGNFSWVNGEEFNYSNWQPSHPEDGIADNGAYAITNGGDLGKWLLKRPGDNYRFVLEIPDEDSNQNEDVNYSLSFDGVDDYVIASNTNYDLTNGGSAHFIVKSSQIDMNNHKYILSQYSYPDGNYSAFEMSIYQGYLNWHIRDNNGGNIVGVFDQIFLADNQWHEVFLIFDGINNQVKVTVDGTTITSDILNLGSINTQTPFYLSRQHYHGHYFNGLINSVTVWDEVVDINRVNDFDNSRILDYSINEGDTFILNDLSDNGNHGNIYGASWIEDVPAPPVYGCTDPYAENYNLEATADDGSCSGYPENGDYVLSFDGIDDWIDITNSTTLDVNENELTIIAKVKVQGSPSMSGGNCSHTSIISKTNSQHPYGGYGIISNQSQLKWNYALASQNSNSWNEVSANSSFLLNEFQLLAGTFNGNEGTAKFFVDNSFETENGFFTGPVRSVNDNVFLGKNPQSDDYCYFNGSIDELVVIKKELLESEIIGFEDYIASNNENILAHYKFNAGVGNVVYDHSGNQNHGTINGAAWQEIIEGCTDSYAENYDENATSDDGSCSGYPDIGEYSLSFDGANGSVVTNLQKGGQDEFTYSAWVKINEFPASNILISQQNDWAWYVRNVNGVQLSFWTSSSSDGMVSYDDFVEDSWYHLALTYQQNTITHFLNGVQLGSSQNITLPNASNFIEFAKWTTDNEVINANMDEITIWNRALNEGHIQALMYGDSIFNQNGLEGYWKFNSGGGSLAIDYSGNQNHGTITSATWSEDYFDFPNFDSESDNSVYFSGGNQNIEIQSPFNGIHSNFTISTWIKYEPKSSEWIRPFFVHSQAYGDVVGGITPNNELLFRIYPGGQGDNGSHSQLIVDFSNHLNNWSYVSLVNNNDGNGNNTQKILINGEEVSSKTWVGEKDWSTGYVSTGIGGKYYDEPQTFKGSISSLEIWSTALTTEQVESKMFYEFIGNESDLVSFWSFDEHSGFIVDDIGPSNNNATLNKIVRNGDAPVPPVYGCTEPYALNYDFQATVNDGSCIDDPNTYHLSFDGESDFIHATNLDDYDGFMISGQPSSTFWHNDFSFTFDISIDLDDIGVGTENFPGMQILSKGYTNDANNPCDNPSSVQIFLEPGNSGKLSFITYQRPGNCTGCGSNTNDFYRVQADAYDIFPTSDFVEFKATFEDTDYYPGMGWGGAHHSVALKLFSNGQEISLTENFDNNFNGMGFLGSPIFVGSRVNSNYETCSAMDFKGKIKDFKLNILRNQTTEVIDLGNVIDWDFTNIGYDIGGDVYGAIIVQDIMGCTDPYAENYNSDAIGDDGSCYGYPDAGNNSLLFSDGDYVRLDQVSNPPQGISDFTFSAKFLIYDSSLPGGSVLLCSETLDQFQFFIGNDGGNGYLDAFIGGDRTFADGITWQENVWYHFTVTRVGGLVTFYLNEEMLTQNESNSSINNVTYYDIGRRNNSAWNHQFNGLLDDISIWSLGLNDIEINYMVSGADSLLNDEGVVASYNFNTGVGDVAIDRSGNQNHGSIQGATWFMPPTLGENNSLSFNGSSDYVKIPTSQSLDAISNGLTLSAWIKPDRYSDGAHTRIFNRTEGFGGGVDRWLFTWSPSVDNYTVNFGGGSSFSEVKGSTPIELNIWTNVVATFENGIVKIYVDGELDSEGNVNFNDISFVQNADITIGSANGNSFFPGKIDNVSIWNRPLEGSEILSQLSSEFVGNEEGLVGYWNFNEGQGQAIYDLSINSNNAINEGAIWSGDAAPVQSPVYGCTDIYASNYSSEADADDGSCHGYPNNGENSILFSDQNDYVVLPNDYDFTDQISYSFSVFPEPIDDQLFIMQRSNAFALRFVRNSENELVLEYALNGPLDYNWFSSNIVVPEQTWSHLTFVYNGSSISLYKNGELEFEHGNLNGNIIETGWDYIQLGNDAGEAIKGRIDEFTIWNYALNTDHIQAIVSQDSILNQNGLEGYWSFNSGEGDIVYDHSGKANHGTIYGGSWDEGYTGLPSLVTFLVNMREFADSDLLSEGVYLAGGNIGNRADEIDDQTGFEMFDNDGDFIYEVTIELERNEFFWYKYRIGLTDGNWQGNWEGLPQDCGYGEWFDRSFYTSNVGSQIVGPYCFSSCENCEVPNMSLSFDGLDDYIDFGTNTSTEISGDISIIAWFKFDDFNNSLSTVLMKESTSLDDNNAYGINKTANGNGLDFVIGDGISNNVVSTQELQAGQWYHLVCTNDGNYSRIYVDGIMHDEIVSGNPSGPNANLKIGLHSIISNQDRFWKGNIDDVSLWNVALSQEQVENFYQNSPIGTEQGLIAYWDFNDGEGNELIDYSGNANHGNIFGATWSGDFPMPPHSGPDWYVSEDNGSDDNNGSEQYPYATIQKAINSAPDGDSILVQSGEYYEIIDISNRSLTILGQDKNNTIINAEQNGPAVRFDNSDNQSAFSKIKGFTISNAVREGDGAGVYAYYGEIVLGDLIIKNNESVNGEGGGISIENSSNSIIYNSIIKNNVARPRGGGINVHNSNVQIINSIINGNTIYSTSQGSGNSGAGLYINQNSSVDLNFVEVSQNASFDQGGAFFIDGNSSISLNNVTMANNSAIGNSSVPFGNENEGNGGAFAAYGNSMINISKSIIWGNVATNNQQMSPNNGAVLSIDSSNVEGLPTAFFGNGNIDENPEFCNSSNGNFQLSQNSSSLNFLNGVSHIGCYGEGCEQVYSNYALSFDGNSDQVELDPSFLDGLGAFTFQAMFYAYQEQGGISNIVQHDGPDHDFYLRYEGNIFRAVQKHNNSEYGVIDIAAPAPRTWHQITFTYDGSISRFYLNGDEQGSFELMGNYVANEAIYLGNWNQQEGFNGIIDEVSLFDYALSSDEILDYANRSLSGFEFGLLAHFNFDNYDGNLLQDISGNGNDGIVTGTTIVEGAPINAPELPAPDIISVNVDINGNDVNFSVDADTTGLGYFDFQWTLDSDSIAVMSFESTSAQDLSPGLHYVRITMVDQTGSLRGDHVLQSFYVLDGFTQYYYTNFDDTTSLGLPEGWNSYSNGQGWYVSDDPFFEYWTAEPGVGNVVISNDDAADNDGQNDFNDGSQDYLNLPPMDFTSFGAPVALEFGSYFTGQWYQSALVTYSIDGGSNWAVLGPVDASYHWQRQYYDLGFLQGNDNVVIGFHSNDNGEWGSGWIIDDVSIIENYELRTTNISGHVFSSTDSEPLSGVSIIAVEENNYFDHQTMSDNNGFFSLDIITGANYYLNISLSDYQDNVQYISVGDSNLYFDIYLNQSQEIQDAIVEGSVFDWYTNEAINDASVLFAYSDGNMQTIELSTDENGYFFGQVPGEKEYDIFIYADGYWVEHDAFNLSQGEHQVISVGIAQMSEASRLYGTIRDGETGDLIPYAEVNLNCEQASDWDRTGLLGTYRLFNYYPGDCDDGVLVVNANGYETSIQSVSDIEFEAGASVSKNLVLFQGNDPEPGIFSGTIISNINGDAIHNAALSAYSINTGQVYETVTDSGSFSLTLAESEYSVAINAEGHQEKFISIYIQSSTQLDTLIYLDEVYSNIVYGVILDNEGTAVSGATVTAYYSDNDAPFEISTISDENGSYQVNLPDGVFNLSAALTTYQVSWINDVSVIDQDLELNFTLDQILSFDGAIMGSVYFFGNLSGSATINLWNDSYSAETVTAENGTYYMDLINGTYSLFASSNGYGSIMIPDAVTIQDNIVNYDIHFSQPGFIEPPVISSLIDHPNDQGRKLDMSWLPGDGQDIANFINYSIWRKITDLPPGAPELWHYIATENFINGLDLYDRVVPTLIDANQDTVFHSTFMVTAHTEDPYVFFDSPPYSGYSIDNLSPDAPIDLSLSNSTIDNEIYQVDLSWSDPTVEDFAYHNVYRNNINDEEVAIVFQTIESSFEDMVYEWGNFEYWVTAVDHNGNESDASEVAGVELSIEQEVMPEEFALNQNYPNPFNPSTQIRYALAENSNVTITIYNMLGNKVRTLVNERQDAGFRNVLWNATNDNGSPVSAGMYIYTIKAGSFHQAKKMILLK